MKLPSDLDIFSPSTSTHPLWTQCRAKVRPTATAWARSFSWCGKVRSWPPPWRSKSVAQEVERHHDALGVPTRPAGTPRRLPARLARLGLLPEDEVEWASASPRRPRPGRRPAASRGSGGPGARSREPDSTVEVDAVAGLVGHAASDQFADERDHLGRRRPWRAGVSSGRSTPSASIASHQRASNSTATSGSVRPCSAARSMILSSMSVMFET